MAMSRYPDKNMLKGWGAYDTTIKLCNQAHTRKNVRRYQRLLNTLQSSFYKFDEDWRLFKGDAIKKNNEEDAITPDLALPIETAGDNVSKTGETTRIINSTILRTEQTVEGQN